MFTLSIHTCKLRNTPFRRIHIVYWMVTTFQKIQLHTIKLCMYTVVTQITHACVACTGGRNCIIPQGINYCYPIIHIAHILSLRTQYVNDIVVISHMLNRGDYSYICCYVFCGGYYQHCGAFSERCFLCLAYFPRT